MKTPGRKRSIFVTDSTAAILARRSSNASGAVRMVADAYELMCRDALTTLGKRRSRRFLGPALNTAWSDIDVPFRTTLLLAVDAPLRKELRKLTTCELIALYDMVRRIRPDSRDLMGRRRA